jgi:hypothetical protein
LEDKPLDLYIDRIDRQYTSTVRNIHMAPQVGRAVVAVVAILVDDIHKVHLNNIAGGPTSAVDIQMDRKGVEYK